MSAACNGQTSALLWKPYPPSAIPYSFEDDPFRKPMQSPCAFGFVVPLFCIERFCMRAEIGHVENAKVFSGIRVLPVLLKKLPLLHRTNIRSRDSDTGLSMGTAVIEINSHHRQ